MTDGSTSQQITQTLRRRVPALRIDAELVQWSPSPGADGYGVACAAGDVAFVFEIDAEAGGDALRVAESNELTELESGTSAAIAGLGATNRLRAACASAPEGVELRLSVNGRPVAATTWRGIAGSFESLAVRVASGEGGTQVELDDLLARAG